MANQPEAKKSGISRFQVTTQEQLEAKPKKEAAPQPNTKPAAEKPAEKKPASPKEKPKTEKKQEQGLKQQREQKKTARAKTEKRKGIENPPAGNPAAFAAAILVLSLVVWNLYPPHREIKTSQLPQAEQSSSRPPICEGEKNSKDFLVSKQRPKFQKFQIPSGSCLSRTVKIPGGRCFWIDAPGWLEYYFPNGEKFRVGENEQQRFSPPSSNFRLMGKAGTAKIQLESCNARH